MAKRTIKQRVDEFMEKNPRKQLFMSEMNEINETGNAFDMITYSYYLGYMRGMKAKKGGVKI